MNNNNNMMNGNNNINMESLIRMLSQMDKTQLENGFAKVNQMLNSKDKEKIINEINKNMNNK